MKLNSWAGIAGLVAASGIAYLWYKDHKTNVTNATAGNTTDANALGASIAPLTEAYAGYSPGITPSAIASYAGLLSGGYQNFVPDSVTSPNGYTAADLNYGVEPSDLSISLSNGYQVVQSSSGETTLVPGMGSSPALAGS